MPALIAVISGNANNLKKELLTVEQLAKRAGVTIEKNLGRGAAHAGGFGSSGFLRELLVLVREVSRGNWSRVPGSLSILFQRSGMLEKAFTFLKTAGGTAIGGIVGAAAAAAGAFYIWHQRVKSLTKDLTGLTMPDLGVEHIAQKFQRINQVLETQKEINKEIAKSVDLYNSAANQAKRSEEITKSQFEYLRKMAEYEEQNELNKAKTDKEKQEIRERYAQRGIEINKQERQQQLSNKVVEQANLLNEADRKQKAADAIFVNSKQHDEQELRNKKKLAEEAEKQVAGMEIRGSGKKAFELKSNEEIAEIQKAQKDKKDEAVRLRKEADEAEDRMASNDELRSKRAELAKQAGEAAGRAATLDKEIAEDRKNNSRKAIEDAQEAAAKLQSAETRGLHPTLMRGDLTNLQKHGAFAPDVQILDINKRMEHHLKSIDGKMSRNGGFSNSGIGGVKY